MKKMDVFKNSVENHFRNELFSATAHSLSPFSSKYVYSRSIQIEDYEENKLSLSFNQPSMQWMSN